MSDLITQAQIAVDREDWSTLVNLLQLGLFTPTPPADGATALADWLPLAMTALAEGDFQVQWEVAKLFPNFGKVAIAPLVELLQDDTAELEARWYAARILGELNDVAAIAALVTQLNTSTDDDLSAVVAEALANLGSAGIEALTTLLPAPATRHFALKALAQIHQPAIIEPVLMVVADPAPAMRVLALETLSTFDDPRLPAVFMQAVKDPAAAVRRVAIASLGAHPDWVINGDRLSCLTECLWDLNLGVCRQTALTLGKIGNETAVPALKRVLLAQNTPPDLQGDVILALSWIGDSTAFKALQAGLPPHNLELTGAVLKTAISQLGRWSDPARHASIVQTFSRIVERSSEPELRLAIATALGELKHPAGLEPLIQLLADADPVVRLHAIVALQQVDPEMAYSRLTGLQASPVLSESLRDGVIVALREWNAQLPR